MSFMTEGINKGIIIRIILKTTPHNYPAPLTIYKGFLCPLALSEPAEAGNVVPATSQRKMQGHQRGSTRLQATGLGEQKGACGASAL